MSFYRPEEDAATPDPYGRREEIATPEVEAIIRAGHVLTPSNVNPWFGAWREGFLYTGEQLRELGRLGIDADTVDRIAVRVKARNRELWVPMGRPMPVRLITCPIVGHKKGQITVIAPSGVRVNVWPGGHLRLPKTAFARASAGARR